MDSDSCSHKSTLSRSQMINCGIKYHTLKNRTVCRAKIAFSVKNEKFVIQEFIEDDNQEDNESMVYGEIGVSWSIFKCNIGESIILPCISNGLR